jgi:hypothetical protein
LHPVDAVMCGKVEHENMLALFPMPAAGGRG